MAIDEAVSLDAAPPASADRLVSSGRRVIGSL